MSFSFIEISMTKWTEVSPQGIALSFNKKVIRVFTSPKWIAWGTANLLKNEVVDPVSGKSYVSAKIYFLGNRVKHNTNSSKEFLEALKSINDVIGIVPEKEAINTSMLLKKGIFDYLEETGQTHTQNKFIASLKKVFNQIETKGIE